MKTEARSAGLSVHFHVLYCLASSETYSKIAFGFTFTYVNRECYYTPPATSVKGGARGKV